MKINFKRDWNRLLIVLSVTWVAGYAYYSWGNKYETLIIETSVTDKEIVPMESLFALLGQDIDATENFIFQETGRQVQVESCGFYECYYPVGSVSECSTDIGKIFITHIGGDLTLSSGFPPDIEIKITRN